MRVVLFANGWVGLRIAEQLRRTDEVVGVVLNAPARRRLGDEIADALALPPDRRFDARTLRDPGAAAALADLGGEIGVSALFGHILRRDVLDAFPRGCVNVHPAYLPYNRGAHPNVWSIVDGTPAGATLHHVDDGVDTGDVIARRRVEVEPVDTAETLYRKLEVACVGVFEDAWPAVRAGTAPRHPQPTDCGTSHRVADLARLDELDSYARYTVAELVDLLRARTFPPYPATALRVGGRRMRVRVALEYAEDDADADA